MTLLTSTQAGVGTTFLPKTGFLRSSWKALTGVLAEWRCILKACGAQYATICGTRRKRRSCASSWAAGLPCPAWERPTLARALAPFFWMMCSALGRRSPWGSVLTLAGSSTTVGTRKTLVSSAPVNHFPSFPRVDFSLYPIILLSPRPKGNCCSILSCGCLCMVPGTFQNDTCVKPLLHGVWGAAGCESLILPQNSCIHLGGQQ